MSGAQAFKEAAEMCDEWGQEARSEGSDRIANLYRDAAETFRERADQERESEKECPNG